jgi:penicillin amidase
MILRWSLLLALLAAQPGTWNLEPGTDAPSVLAQISGRIELSGLNRPVEVLRDPWGVPHIYAQDVEDLFFAQGFVAAQDRLWQMEMWRRAGEGRLAEVLGEQAIQRDTYARLMAYRGDMKAEWESYAPDAQRIIVAFVRGVNAYIRHTRDRLPVEFQIMGFRPEMWSPEVCLTRQAGYVMTGNAASEVQRAQLVAAVGPERAAEIMPPDPPTTFEPAPGIDVRSITPQILSGHRANAAPYFPRRDEAGDGGSNNWTISGKRTVTGKPFLANDPHRTIALPSLRYLAHLVGPGWNVIGAGEPSLPGLAAGHNERVAFGFTIFAADMQDIYVEETDPADSTRYRFGKAWETMRIVKEQIRVKGRPAPVEVELRFTRHGPVIHEDRAAHRAYALRWAGHEPGGAGYLASLALDRAKNWKEFREALKRWKLPPENLVYADVDGNIGYQAAGLVPRRTNWNGLLPVPGNGRYEWEGFLALDELPNSFNPAEGFIATANHRTIPATETKVIGYEWAAPDRFLRIQEVLRSKDKFTLEDMERLQHDEVSVSARELVKLLPESAPAMLRQWDGTVSRDSAAAALYEVTLTRLRPKVYDALLPAAQRQGFQGRAALPVMLRRLREMPAGAKDKLILEALGEAQVELRKRLGEDESRWRWGLLHHAAFQHPLSGEFDLSSVPRGGDGTTPNATSPGGNFRQTSGASFREILDLADWDRSRASNVPGQSGQPGSPHYGDLLPLWAEGQYFPLLYSRAAVEKGSRNRLWLAPQRAMDNTGKKE